MSRIVHMEGARKIKLEDISFESEAHNIFDPFFSSESSDGYYTDTSDEDSCYDSETQKSSIDESTFTSQDLSH